MTNATEAAVNIVAATRPAATVAANRKITKPIGPGIAGVLMLASTLAVFTGLLCLALLTIHNLDRLHKTEFAKAQQSERAKIEAASVAGKQ